MAVGAGKQRALLALLLLHGNDVVSVDRLTDGLWDGGPPASAKKAIQVYVSRLRKALGAQRIRTSGPGYLLELEPDELDLGRFERLVAEARELRPEEPARASAALREALALWHGSPLADLADEPFAEAEIARLEGLRIAALEERMDADLALGLGAELVAELQTLVAKNPYRERLRGQLMLALYRAGRQADALATYQETRRLFVGELGIEPSRALQRVERAILQHESGLDVLLEEVDEAPVEADEPVREVQEAGWLRASRRRPLLALVGLLLAASVAAVAVARAMKPHYLHGVEANAIGVIDAKGVGVEKQYALDWRSGAIASDGHIVWTTDAEGDTISRIEPGRNPVIGNMGFRADGVAYGRGSLWATNGLKRRLVQLDPITFGVVQRIRVGNGPRSVAVGKDAVWVANTIDGTVTRTDLDTGVPGDPIPVGPNPVGIAVGAGGVWVASEAGTVLRIDPRSSQVVGSTSVGNGPSGVAYGENAVWVANRDDGTVSKIDPATGRLADTIPVGGKPEAIIAGHGAVWVADSGDATIRRIDTRTGKPVRTLRLGSNANSLALADGKVWATTSNAGGHRGGVLRVEAPTSDCTSVDPVEWPSECIIPPLVYDGLVAYRRLGGVAGETLVPNLAVRIPTPTNEGRTYVFQLRPRLRYSNGDKVVASDFRYSIERFMQLRGGPDLLGAIVGARDCSAKKCDLSKGIRVDDRTRTITIRLTKPDADLIHKLALPSASIVSAGTPIRYARARPIPSVGPYRIASIDLNREIRLVRNEHFRQWAPNARPDGYADEIRIHLRDNPEARLAAVKKGAADWVDLSLGLDTEQMKGLLTRYARQLHSSLASESDWLFLNTRVRPFDDIRARRAVNFAIDRKSLVDRAGKIGPPSCQLLPPNLPEYQPYCPYTRRQNAAGTWTAPNLSKARALVRASRTAGMPVTVDSTPLRSTVSEYVASVLRRIGYRATVRIHDPNAYYSYVSDSRNGAQIGWAGWAPDYLAAANFLRPLFTCEAFVPRSPDNQNLFEFCDPALDARMAHAADVQRSDPAQATELWSAVDRELVDRAVAVPWSTPRERVLVSERVGNYQGHPLWGTLLDQLWVR